MRGSSLRGLAGMLICAVGVGLSAAGSATADDRVIEELKRRLDLLEKQNEDLRKKVEGEKSEGREDREKEKLRKEIESHLKDLEKQKKEADERKAREREAAGFEVGKLLDFKARWQRNQLWFETEDRAFRLHVMGRTQVDGTWVHAPQRLQVPLAQQGIGEYDNAVNFRRARLGVEGTLWEVLDFQCEFDFLNTVRIVSPGGAVQNNQTVTTEGTSADRNSVINTPVPTEQWVQLSHIPWIGHVRVGNHKQWISMEHMTSSAFLPFMERSIAFDAFVENGNNGFAPGVSVWNNYLDDNLLLALGVFTPNFRDIFGWNVGDGEMQVIGRVAGTPAYREEGRCMLHLGLGYMHSTADDRVIRFRTRPLVRNGPAVLHNVIAQIQGTLEDYHLVVPEVMLIQGPFSVAAEFYGAWVNQDAGGVFQRVGSQSGNVLPRGDRGRLFYHGGYAEVGYFLTGESRSYDRTFKRLARQQVYEPVFIVGGAGGGWHLGRGAWQVVARYSWADLDSKGVNGGVIHDVTLGLNWFLNPNAKIQINYFLEHRDATQYGPGGTVVSTSLRDGLIQGLGCRLALDW